MSVKERKVVVTEIVVVAVVVAIAMLLQALVGSFPTDIFTFPLNIICMALWLVACYLLYKHRETSALAQSLLSTRATWLSLAAMVATGLYLGLQSQPNSTAWPIVLGILFTLTHLLLITMRGWRTAKGIRWRFTLLHAGLIIALGAGFWGSPDRVQLRTMLQDKPVNHAYHLDSTLTNLDYTMQLEECNTEYNTSGMPTHFEAKVSIDNEIVTLKVNHPYNRTFGEKIYLVSINQEHGYCIVEIVREPWQWASLAGIILILAGAVMLFIRGPRHMANKKMK
ncbi:MAG: cytochrome c biogenesis protein ResB [Alistipes sp.]|nr:cytochrome c biogenesis protein ResB [Alistipes sp.]